MYVGLREGVGVHVAGDHGTEGVRGVRGVIGGYHGSAIGLNNIKMPGKSYD